MITFGFKNKFGGAVRAIAALVLGALLVISPENSVALVVKFFACFLIASGLVSLITGIKQRKSGGEDLMYVNSAVDILLGVLVFVFAGFIGHFILFLIGGLLMAFGVFQIVVLFSARRYTTMGTMAFLLPALACIGGAVLLLNPFSQKVMGLIAGIALLVYGASELLSHWKMDKAMDAFNSGYDPDANFASKAQGNVKDVDFEPTDNSVDEQ